MGDPDEIPLGAIRVKSRSRDPVPLETNFDPNYIPIDWRD